METWISFPNLNDNGHSADLWGVVSIHSWNPALRHLYRASISQFSHFSIHHNFHLYRASISQLSHFCIHNRTLKGRGKINTDFFRSVFPVPVQMTTVQIGGSPVGVSPMRGSSKKGGLMLPTQLSNKWFLDIAHICIQGFLHLQLTSSGMLNIYYWSWIEWLFLC